MKVNCFNFLFVPPNFINTHFPWISQRRQKDHTQISRTNMKSLYARRQREVETNSSLSCWKEEDKRLRGIQKGIWEVNYSKTCSTSRGICMSATLCKYNNQSFVFSPNQIQTQITGAEIRVTQNIEDDNYTTREREKSFFFLNLHSLNQPLHKFLIPMAYLRHTYIKTKQV